MSRSLDDYAQDARELYAELVRAREDLEDWAAYASDYFQEKWHLADDLARIDAVLAEHKENAS